MIYNNESVVLNEGKNTLRLNAVAAVMKRGVYYLQVNTKGMKPQTIKAVSYTHLRAHETVLDLVCRLLLENKKKKTKKLHKTKQKHNQRMRLETRIASTSRYYHQTHHM